MKDKIWDVEHKGHNIRAINRVSFFPPQTSEILEIDGTVIEHVKGSFLRRNSAIVTKHSFEGEEHEVEVRIAQNSGGIGIGCQIFVDSIQIGGDKAIQYPDPKKAEEQVRKGYARYFVTTGLLRFGLPFAIIMAFFNRTDPASTIAWKFTFHMLFFGLAMSYFSWRGIKSIAEKV